MGQIFKLFIIDKKPYLTVDEDVKIGDKAVVAVSDMYATLIECKNDEQINLIQRPQTSLTKRYKVVLNPEEVKLEESMLNSLIVNEVPVIVEYDNGDIKIVENL